MKLSEHFDSNEFACRCGCGSSEVDPLLVLSLERLRSLCGGQPITITSGRRCPEHNSQVGGAPNSQHLSGTAADIRVAQMSPDRVADLAENVPAFRRGGVGRYDTFTHVDVRRGRARWDYRTKR